MAEKPHMNLIFIGHVDHGKSTTVGRLLFETGALNDRDMEKYKELAKQFNRPTFEFAFVMDQQKEERERGITIDIAHKEFTTEKYYFTIIDAPGHKDFVKNMITGANQADAAVLVVSVYDGVGKQTREHAILTQILGIGQVIIGFNKMDKVGYDQKKYEEAKKTMIDLLKPLGYKNLDTMPFIPYSAFGGDNIAKKSTNMPWYTGPTLLDALNNLTIPNRPTDKPLRLPIEDVYSISGHGTVPVGRVESGIMKPNDQVVIMPEGIKSEVKSIEMHKKQIAQALPGDNVGFNLKNIEKKDIKRGDVLGSAAKPPMVVSEFTGQIVILHHPNVITKGYTPVFHVHTARILHIRGDTREEGPEDGSDHWKKPGHHKTGDIAIVRLKPNKPLVIKKASEFPIRGRFIIRGRGRPWAGQA